MTKGMTYAGAGVGYDQDLFKRMAQMAAKATHHHTRRFGFSIVEWSLGESAVLFETPIGHFGFVVEGLGTKQLIADEMRALAREVEGLLGKKFHFNVVQCNTAMAVNDLITVGARPFLYGQYFAAGNGALFKDESFCREVVAGTVHACDLAQAAWGCGETPTLRGVIVDGTEDFAGAALGFIPKGSEAINPANIEDGDKIAFISSTGINANGLTLAREIAAKLARGYRTEVSNGLTLGETLLEPTLIYSKLVEDCLDAGVEIHYAINITGHGWRKLMRAPQPFTYVIDHLPEPLPIFEFLQRHGPVDDREAYATWNMGAGFALIVPQRSTHKLWQVLEGYKPPHCFAAVLAGHVERSPARRVLINPVGIKFDEKDLQIR